MFLFLSDWSLSFAFYWFHSHFTRTSRFLSCIKSDKITLLCLPFGQNASYALALQSVLLDLSVHVKHLIELGKGVPAEMTKKKTKKSIRNNYHFDKTKHCNKEVLDGLMWFFIVTESFHFVFTQIIIRPWNSATQFHIKYVPEVVWCNIIANQIRKFQKFVMIL